MPPRPAPAKRQRTAPQPVSQPAAVRALEQREYGEASYWQQRYDSNASGDADEWLAGYADLEHVLRPQLAAVAALASPFGGSRRRGVGRGGPRLLMLGCGDSAFSADLYDAGFRNITNVDISEVCIANMRRREAQRRPTMTWRTADCTDLACFPDGSFDAVIDKTLFDTLCTSDEAWSLIPSMLDEVSR
jgi:2-polyprenyl-3-methyl-5-hydroxy-6-metoxy-1,4-benzoquinol methylase